MKQRSLLLFENGIKSKATKIEYIKNLDRFKDFYKLKDYDSILTIEAKKLQEMIEDYVMDMKNKVSPNTVPTRIFPLQAFFEINDVEIKWKKIRRLFPAKIKKTGGKAYSTEQVQKLLNQCTNLRNRAIVLFLTASWCRVGAFSYLKLKDITTIENCKHVVIYSGEVEEYSTFLTPEASNAFDQYIEQRKKDGEYLDDSSPAFRKTYRLGIEKPQPITHRSVSELMQRLLKSSGIRGTKTGARYDIQTDHGLRKRFNTIMKQTPTMKLIHSEKMFGHSTPSIPLDETYADFSISSLFEEYKKAISELTIDDSLRKQSKLEKIEKEKSELEKVNIILQQTIKEKDEIAQKSNNSFFSSNVEKLVSQKVKEILEKQNT